MDIDPVHRDRIEQELKRIFNWLDASRKSKDDVLGAGLELSNTPLILLSSLARGADQWVVQSAPTDRLAGVRTVAPLPFVRDQYLQASTFKRGGETLDEAASKFLADFPGRDVFVVRMRDELDLDDDELRIKHASILSGPENKPERDGRYAAAGEYVAAYCDVLIALTDKPIGRPEDAVSDPGQSPGARAIAELKRRGITPDRLPILPALSWADNGPVIHVYSPREPKEGGVASSSSPQQAGEDSGDAGKLLEMLYPYDWSSSGASKEDDNPEWVREGREALESVAEHLREFNSETVSNPTRESEAFAEMLRGEEHGVKQERRGLQIPTAGEPYKATLDRLARARRRVADWSDRDNRTVIRLKTTMFCLAFCVVLFLSLAENWEVSGLVAPVRLVFFLIALALMLAIWFAHLAGKKPAKRRDDYRAIAEGQRVQFYWTACGSCESVASNYLQRQRGELGWIRNVISSIAFPYEPCRVWFKQLSRSDSQSVLKSIQNSWLDGQHSYFRHQKERLTRRERVLSVYSTVLVSTGVILQGFLLWYPESIEPRILWSLLTLLPLVIATLIICALYFKTRLERSQKEEVAKHRSRGFSLAEKLLPKWIESSWGRRIVCILIAIAFSFLAIGMIDFLVEGLAGLPPARNLIAIFKNLAFAGGVLCGLWIQTNFFKENLRRYESMASLFQAASVRFDDHFRLLTQLDSEEKSRAQRSVVAKLQSLLVAVGREALSENAEWLITHRARPLEPISALG